MRDIAERHKVKDLDKLKKLALFYGAHFTRTLSFNKIMKIKEFSLSLDSIHRFSHFFEGSFLVYFLQRFSYSLKNQIQADRKVYFADNGLRNAISFRFSHDYGKLLENALYLHLRQKGEDLYYFAEKQEVDFIVKRGLSVSELINVCYDIEDKETLEREKGALIEGMKYFGLKESTLITGESEEKAIVEKGFTIRVIPFCQWALTENRSPR